MFSNVSNFSYNETLRPPDHIRVQCLVHKLPKAHHCWSNSHSHKIVTNHLRWIALTYNVILESTMQILLWSKILDIHAKSGRIPLYIRVLTEKPFRALCRLLMHNLWQKTIFNYSCCQSECSPSIYILLPAHIHSRRWDPLWGCQDPKDLQTSHDYAALCSSSEANGG